MTRVRPAAALLLALSGAAMAGDGTSPAVRLLSADPAEGLGAQPIEEYPFMQVIAAAGRAEYGSRDLLVSGDGRLRVDHSRYAQVTLRLVDWPMDEVMYFLEGQVEITDAAGNGAIYGPGDLILMPRGFTGTWRQLSDIRKISISYAPEDPWSTSSAGSEPPSAGTKAR
jgi:ethanolamine utilization protein EutQ (cupin superfamily)